MSAFMVSDKHIRFLVACWRRYASHGAVLLTHELEAMARGFKAENRRSLAHRYPGRAKRDVCPSCGETVCDPRPFHRSDDDPTLLCPFALVAVCSFDASDFTPVRAIKAAQCYEYQSNEHQAWESCQSEKLIAAILSGAISALPGYNDAPWGIV